MNESSPHKKVALKPKDPTASSRTWAIALVVSACFLLVALGVAVWIFTARGGNVTILPPPPTDPAIGIKSVSFVLPTDMPAAYVKYDQSQVGESFVFYDDEAAGCSLVLGVLPSEADKTPQATALARIANAYTQGVTTTNTTLGERFVVKDQQDDYSFESVVTEQSVAVTAVDVKTRHQLTMFKKLGQSIVVIGYGCKAETWEAKQAELATLVSGITLKTER